ncbi:MAG: hypothetical protein A3F10_06370 [Coxiella sp. RIFCSPHIGHO2_12_FULL_42_15]|nr:MAG: hypothetical protein A3F10_06370 [Coxiella sp. RIFCSPHIGHO2_12_FULL_42_15]
MQTLRPFYFIVVVWGKQFRDYLTDYCIPSLLAPNNIPKLINNEKNKFLICTTLQDWQELQIHPTIIKLQQHIEPVLVEIPAPPQGVSSCQHMGIGHKIATEKCFADKAYGIALTPDVLVSNGTMESVQKHALAGKHVVLCAAVRFAEEPFFAGIQKMGLRSENNEFSASSRQLVQLCLDSFHSETESYDFESANYKYIRAVALWKMPNKAGLLLHSLSWCPLLIDYGAMLQHDTSALENWTMDGDYIYKNIHDHNKIYACQDSDEIMIVSWSPLQYHQLPLKSMPAHNSTAKKFINLKNRFYLAATLKLSIFDPLKLKLFWLPIFWHVNDIDTQWKEKETFVAHVLTRLPHPIYRKLFHFGVFTIHYVKKIFKYSFITFLVFCGSKKARQRLLGRIHLFLHTRKTHVTQ